MSTKLSKRSFTLIEMLIVIGLIAVALCAMALPISRMLRKERFERGVDQVIAKLTLAQELMLDAKTDVKLLLEQDGDNVVYTLTANSPLPERVEKGFNHRKRIEGITEMAFNHERRTSIEFQFDSTLGTTSKGTLTLLAQDDQADILLKGYPAHLHRGKDDLLSIQEAQYPEEILSAL